MIKSIKELYEYREMIFSLIRRELRGKYKGSVLGFLWAFLNPLLQLIVYTIVFSLITRSSIEDFYLYLFVVLIPWMYISACMTGGATCITGQTELVKKIYFPRLVLPISYATSQFVNMLLSFVVVFAVLIVSGKGINPVSILFLPIIMIIEYIMGVAIAILFSCINVYLRDLQQVSGVLSMAWQFFSPVLYSIEETIPEQYISIYMMNPIAPMVVIYRQILYYKQIPDWELFLNPLVFSICLLVISCLVFSKLKKHFAEEL